jgi:hypothetical protein
MEAATPHPSLSPLIWRGIFPRFFGSLHAVFRFYLEAGSGMVPVVAEATTIDQSLRPAHIEGRTCMDTDHRMADVAALVSRPPVAAWANYLETWRVMETFTTFLQLHCPNKVPGVTL